jgi:tetratricopeptide (TPR) repeat protein
MRDDYARLSKLLIALLLGVIIASPAPAADRNSDAQALQTQGNWSGLQKLATDWSKSEPNSPAPWLYLGTADDQLGQTSDAITAYEKAVSIQPQLVTAWMPLAADYHKTGQTQKLVSAIQRLQTINPSVAMMLQSQYAGDLKSSQPAQGAGGPSGIPQKAAQALARAKQWHSDAQLMMIDINDFSNNGNFLVNLYFRSPSSGAGYMVSDAGALPVAAANWGTIPIPAQFIDLPAAVNAARAQGMVGAFNHAMLQGSAQGPVWTITPTKQSATANDPYARRGAFQVPAGAR